MRKRDDKSSQSQSPRSRIQPQATSPPRWLREESRIMDADYGVQMAAWPSRTDSVSSFERDLAAIQTSKTTRYKSSSETIKKSGPRRTFQFKVPWSSSCEFLKACVSGPVLGESGRSDFIGCPARGFCELGYGT